MRNHFTFAACIVMNFFVVFNAEASQFSSVPRYDNPFLKFLNGDSSGSVGSTNSTTWKPEYYRYVYKIVKDDKVLMGSNHFNAFGGLCDNYLELRPDIRASIWPRFMVALAAAETNLTKAGQASVGAKADDRGLLQMNTNNCASASDLGQISCALETFKQRASEKKTVYATADDDSLNWSVLRHGVAKVSYGTVFGKLGTKFIPLFSKFVPECQVNNDAFIAPPNNSRSRKEFKAIGGLISCDRKSVRSAKREFFSNNGFMCESYLPGTNININSLVYESPSYNEGLDRGHSAEI